MHMQGERKIKLEDISFESDQHNIYDPFYSSESDDDNSCYTGSSRLSSNSSSDSNTNLSKSFDSCKSSTSYDESRNFDQSSRNDLTLTSVGVT